MLRHATLAILALACDAFMLQPAAPAHRPAASLCAAPSVSPVAARASVLEMAAKPKARPVAKKPVAKKPVAMNPFAKRPAPARKPVAKKPAPKRPAPARKPVARSAAKPAESPSEQLKNLFSLSLVKSAPAKSGPARKAAPRGSVVRTINRKGAPAPRTRDGLVAEARTGRTAGEEISFLAGQTVDAVGGLNPILVNPAFYAVAAVWVVILLRYVIFYGFFQQADAF